MKIMVINKEVINNGYVSKKKNETRKSTKRKERSE